MTKTKTPTRWGTTQEALAEFKVSRMTLYRLVDRGEIQKHRFPGIAANFYDLDALARLLQSARVYNPETGAFEPTDGA